jgi:hypothetical protein
LEVTKEDLFIGEYEPLGGLSNEHDLARICPDDFKNMHNPWSGYAANLFCSGGNIKDWKWKSLDIEKQRQQLSCLRGVLSGFDLDHMDKIALAGWMLSEMLSEVPSCQ